MFLIWQIITMYVFLRKGYYSDVKFSCADFMNVSYLKRFYES